MSEIRPVGIDPDAKIHPSFPKLSEFVLRLQEAIAAFGDVEIQMAVRSSHHESLVLSSLLCEVIKGQDKHGKPLSRFVIQSVLRPQEYQDCMLMCLEAMKLSGQADVEVVREEPRPSKPEASQNAPSTESVN